MTFITNPINGILSPGNTTSVNIGGQTTLNENLTIGDTTAITLTDASSFPTAGTIRIESEYITYTNKTGNDLDGTITRGAFGSSASAHTLGVTVFGTFIGQGETNTQPDVLVSMESDQPGTEYFEYSDDNSTWTTSPTNGFTITANTNEVHSNTKANRFFRVRFENGSVTGTTSLSINTYYGVFEQQIIPLEQSLTSDSDCKVVRSVMTGITANGDYATAYLSPPGHLETRIMEPLLPFGSIHVENMTPIYQIDAVYGINDTLLLSTIGNLTGGASSATVSGANNLLTCTTGTTVFSYSSIQSKVRLRYRPGQGIISRFTALYSAPVASSILVAGIGTAESGLFFGYNGADFSILYSTGGVRESRLLTITAGATGATNYTVTLNGIAFVFPAVDTSGSTLITAREVANGTYAGWQAEQRGSTVLFLSGTAGAKPGAFTFSHATATGTFGGPIQTGASPTNTWIPQSSWNMDKMDGTGPSGVTLDPSKGNVFQIGIQYLGFGTLTFAIETTSTMDCARFTTVHIINNPNTLTSTNLSQPSMPYTMSAYSAGSTTDVSVSSATIAGFIEGQKVLSGPRYTYERETNNYVSNAGSNYYPFFTIRNSLAFANPGTTERPNQSVVNITSISVVHDDNTPIIFYILKEATLTGPTNFTKFATNSVTYWDIASTIATISDNDQLIFSVQTGQQTGETIMFDPPILLQPGETITVAARTVSATATFVNASLNTREDQ